MSSASSFVPEEKHAAFRQVADHIGLGLEHAPFEIGDHTDLGLFAIIAAETAADFDVVPIADPGDENVAIEQLIRSYEALTPDQLSANLTEYALDPFVIVMSDGVGTVGSDRVQDAETLERMRQYPIKSPRDMTVSNVQIVHIGGSRAAATYTLDENLNDGSSIHCNAAAVVVKISAGWRIAVVTDHIGS